MKGRQSVKFEEIWKSHTFAVIIDTVTELSNLKPRYVTHTFAVIYNGWLQFV